MEVLAELYKDATHENHFDEHELSKPYIFWHFAKKQEICLAPLYEDRFSMSKFCIEYAHELVKSGERDTGGWKVVEVPKIFAFTNLEITMRESKWDAKYSKITGRNFAENNLVERCRVSVEPLPDSVYYGAKWYLPNDKVKMTIPCIENVPYVPAPETLKIGYFPAKMELADDRKAYMKERYEESRKEHLKFHWHAYHSSHTKAIDIHPMYLLQMHMEGHHVHGFFQFEKDQQTGELVIVDIYNRFKFPVVERWDQDTRERFDRVNNYYLNFSQFLRINRKVIEPECRTKQAAKDYKPQRVFQSSFLIVTHPDEPVECQSKWCHDPNLNEYGEFEKLSESGSDIDPNSDNDIHTDSDSSDYDDDDQPSCSSAILGKRNGDDHHDGAPQKKRAASSMPSDDAQ